MSSEVLKTHQHSTDFLLNNKLKENWKGRKVLALGFCGPLVRSDSNKQQLRRDRSHPTHSQEAVDLAVPSHQGNTICIFICIYLHEEPLKRSEMNKHDEKQTDRKYSRNTFHPFYIF